MREAFAASENLGQKMAGSDIVADSKRLHFDAFIILDSMKIKKKISQ